MINGTFWRRALFAILLAATACNAAADEMDEIRELDSQCIKLLTEAAPSSAERWEYDEGAGWGLEWEYHDFNSALLAGALNHKNTYHESGHEQYTQCFRVDGSALSIHRYEDVISMRLDGTYRRSHQDLYFDREGRIVDQNSAWEGSADLPCDTEVFGYATLSAVMEGREGMAIAAAEGEYGDPGAGKTSWPIDACH